MSHTGGPPVSGAGRVESLLVRAFVLARAAALVQIAVALLLDWRHYRAVLPVLALAGVVSAQSAILMLAAVRRGRVRPGWVAADVVFLVACLAAGAALTAPADGHTWVYFMYPVSLISCCSIGIAYQRLRAVLAATAVLATGYVLAAIGIHHDPPWNVMPNAVTYFADTGVVWAVARQLRSGGRAVDASRALAVEQAEDLARERERARHARILHDHALQALESLVRRQVIADDEVHAQIAAEAARLRALVEGTPSRDPGDILASLTELVQRKAAAGMRVEFNHAQLLTSEVRRHIPGHVSEALVDAVHEGLTNIAKHAGATTAIIRATATADLLTVSLLDHGAGFDPGRTQRGVGLQKSIIDRIQEIGGHCHIESAVGAGTYLELTIPAAAWNGSAAIS